MIALVPHVVQSVTRAIARGWMRIWFGEEVAVAPELDTTEPVFPVRLPTEPTLSVRLPTEPTFTVRA